MLHILLPVSPLIRRRIHASAPWCDQADVRLVPLGVILSADRRPSPDPVSDRTTTEELTAEILM